MKKMLFLLIMAATLTSCEKAEELQGDEYFVFGIFNGFCAHNCTTLFKIEDNKLYADDMDVFRPGDELRFKQVPLSNTKYGIAEEAYEDLPDELLNTAEDRFGCPGCADQDIIYLVYFDGTETHEWFVDTDIAVLPDYLQAYAREVLLIVDKLAEE